MSASSALAITHRRVLNIAVPIILSNATIPLLGAVDTGVVGQSGLAAPIGAVGLGAIILSSVYWLFGFLRMGITGLTAQASGQGDQAEVSALLTRALMIGLGAGLILMALQGPIFWAALWVSPASAEVEGLTREYVQIRIWSAPAAIASYGIAGWLIAQERTRAMLAIQLVTIGLNAVLDVWFVLGLDLGVPGVAWGTFIAEWTGFALGLWLCRAAFRSAAWRAWTQVFQRARIVKLAHVSSDILIRSLMLQMVLVSFMIFGARQGDVTLAANQVLMQFLSVAAYLLDAFAFAAEVLVGQAIGAGAKAHFRRAVVLSSVWALALVVLLCAVFALIGDLAIDLMTTSEAVRAMAREYLPWLVALPFLSVAAFQLDGIFIGATRTRDMRNMMAVSCVIYGVALALLLPLFGNHGLWAALLICFAARGVTLALKYPALERQI